MKKSQSTDPSIEDFTSSLLTEINLCRTSPQKYSQKIREYEKYFNDPNDANILKFPNSQPIKTKEGYSSFEEAAMFLDNLDGVNPLKHNEVLSYCAYDALKQIQKYKKITEINDLKVDECLSKFGEVYGPFAQCNDFGTNLPELLLVLLLSDDGDDNRSNRLSLLNPNYRFVGIAHGNHEIFNFCNVLMLCRNFYPLNEKPNDDDEEGEIEDQNEKENVENDNLFYENKLGGKKNVRLEKNIVDSKGNNVKLIKEMKVKNGCLYTNIYKEKI